MQITKFNAQQTNIKNHNQNKNKQLAFGTKIVDPKGVLIKLVDDGLNNCRISIRMNDTRIPGESPWFDLINRRLSSYIEILDKDNLPLGYEGLTQEQDIYRSYGSTIEVRQAKSKNSYEKLLDSTLEKLTPQEIQKQYEALKISIVASAKQAMAKAQRIIDELSPQQK